jgi:LmbE family N-acetylglucosaminyl deacetylase
MTELTLEQVGRYDSLYISPRSGDAALSCAARLHADAGKGLSAVVLNLFEGASFRESASPPRGLPRVDHISLGLPGACRRHPRRSILSSLHFETFPEDDGLRARIARLLVDLRPRIAPRHVFAPLAVGGHVDHRIAHEAAVAAFGGREAGRNVFLYEDRPEALGRGQVRLRLGLLGARLPAGAVRSAERSSFVGHLARHHRGAQLRGEGGGWLDRFRSLAPAAARFRDAAVWNPQKAFGPRLQPVLLGADAEAAAFTREVVSAVVPASRGRRTRYLKLAAAYTRRLGGMAEHVERYWLLLPLLEGGREPATFAVDDSLL